jgi:hypothetical protein
VQQSFLLTVNGSHFVSSSVVVANGTTLSTLATSSQQLQATITTAVISAPGTASVKVNTPSGNSSDLGCTSGGTSKVLVTQLGNHQSDDVFLFLRHGWRTVLEFCLLSIRFPNLLLNQEGT